jgi:hypothetical protein
MIFNTAISVFFLIGVFVDVLRTAIFNILEQYIE